MSIDAVALMQGMVALAVAVAFFLGGQPERWGALVILAMFVLQTALNQVRTQTYLNVDPSSLVMDIFALVNFAVLAIYSNRMWPIWAASLQVLSLSAHFARAFDLGISEMVYGLMKGLPTMMVLVAMMVGTWNHRRVIRRHGFDPSWKRWDEKNDS